MIPARHVTPRPAPPRLLSPRPRLGLSGVPRRAPCAAPPRPLLARAPPRCATSPARLSAGLPLPSSALPRGAPPPEISGDTPSRGHAHTRPRPAPFTLPATAPAFSARLSHPTSSPAPPHAPPTPIRPRPACRTRARAPTQPRPFPPPSPLVPRSRGARSPPAPPSCHPLCVSHPHGLCGVGAEPLPGQPLSGGRSRQ